MLSVTLAHLIAGKRSAGNRHYHTRFPDPSFLRWMPAVVLLFRHNEIVSSVFLPAALGGLSTVWIFLAVADKRYPLCRNSHVRKIFFGAHCATLAQRLVVLFGPPFVAVALDLDIHIRICLEPCGVRLHDVLCVIADKGLVKIKINRQQTGRCCSSLLFGSCLRYGLLWRRLLLRRSRGSCGFFLRFPRGLFRLFRAAPEHKQTNRHNHSEK